MLCPPMPTLAFPHDHSLQRTRQLDVDGRQMPYNDQSAWAGIAILTEEQSTSREAAAAAATLADKEHTDMVDADGKKSKEYWGGPGWGRRWGGYGWGRPWGGYGRGWGYGHGGYGRGWGW